MAKLPPRTRRPFFAILLSYFWISLGSLLLVYFVDAIGIRSVDARVAAGELLLPNRKVETKLAGGDARTYKIPVAAKQYLRIVVEQHGIILKVSLFDPSQKELITTDNPSGAHGPIYLSAISESGGEYRLEVRSTEKWANAGRFKIAVEPLRDPIEADHARLNAEKNYAEGRQLLESAGGSAERKQKLATALEKFQTALSHWEGTKDPHWIALLHYCLAVTHRALDDRKTAAIHFDKSIEVQIDEELDWRLRASVFNDRGANFGRLRDEQKAFESLNEALKIYERHGDRRGQASALNNMGFLHLSAGRHRVAQEILEKALPHRRAENDRANEAIVLNGIAGSLDGRGETRAALKGYQEALHIWEDLHKQGMLNNPLGLLAPGFNNVALAYDRLGEWQEAIKNYEKALALYGPNPPVAAAFTLDNIGELHAVLGDRHKAMEFYERARKLSEGKETRALANVLNHIGELYLAQNDLVAALPFFEQTYELKADKTGKAYALTNIGSVYALRREPRKALDYYTKALALIENGEDRRALASTLQKAGEAYALLHEPGKALEALNRALPLWRAVADQRGEAAALYAIAGVERDRGNLAAALDLSKQSIAIIESLRTKVASQRLRSSFFASQQSHYALYIDLRMRLYQSDKSTEHLAAAFVASEQSRARSLVDTLTDARANLYRGVSEDLIKLEREAQQKVNNKARIQLAILNRNHSEEEAAAIESEVTQAIAEYNAIRDKIQNSSPAHAQLTQAQSLDLSQIQQLLDDDTLLLEYFLGEDKSYLWLVSKTSISGADLPKRAEIENSAKAFYEGLSKLTSNLNDVKLRGAARKNRATTTSVDPAVLSQMLLGPVADKIGKKRLLIVGDGVLYYLPFGALPAPRATNAETQKTLPVTRKPYLIEEHEIVCLPSASVLAVLRAETAARKPVPLSVAVLANPVFTKDDERFKTSKQNPAPGATTIAQTDEASSAAGVGVTRSGLTLIPLPATEEEATAIDEVMRNYGRTDIATGFGASRAHVLKLQEDQHRIVHFATHGDLNTEHPELSSIVLSLFDSKGQPQEGFLRLHDIYNLRLPADLIVLSACSTGLGHIIKGEGLIGLTRGFMHAGSPRIVASLWRVDDTGTSDLMRRFYQHLARGEMSPPSALRQAQLEMLQTRRGKAPYFWAGFVVQGEWSAIR